MRFEELYAGFWRRFFSALIDAFVINIVLFPMLWVLSFVLLGIASMFWAIFIFLAGFLAFGVYFFIYFFFLSIYSASPGELLLKTRVFDSRSQGAVSRSQVIKRSIASALMNFGPLQSLFFVNMLLVIFSEKKQTIADMLARVVVIKTL